MNQSRFKCSSACGSNLAALAAHRIGRDRAAPCAGAQRSSPCSKDNGISAGPSCLPVASDGDNHLRAEFPVTLVFDGALEEEDSPVVQDAVDLARRQPWRTALWILDNVMQRRARQCLDLMFDDDELGAPHPFAELLRQAFASHLDPAELALMECEAASHPEITYQAPYELLRREWEKALRRFAERYDLWSPIDG